MEPLLYCIIRTDIADMNPGKAAAQAMHAQAEFQGWIADQVGTMAFENYAEWKEDRTFGTTLVVLGSMNDIERVLSANVDSGVVVDPTYPIRNYYGDVFTTSDITCAWVFLTPDSSEDDWEMMKTFPLMP